MLVVNGGPEPHRRLADLDEREWDRVIDAHVTQPFLLFKHLVPLMGPDRLGKVVVTTGVETARGTAGQAHLAAARHAVFGQAKDLACEVAGRQVNVNVSCPAPDADDEHAAGHAAALRALTDNVLWLSSDAARFVTATAVHVNRVAG